jgi:ATP-binding cassette subfamily C protein
MLMLVFLIGASASGLAGPLLLGHIVDLVVDGRGADAMSAPAALLLLLAVVQGLLTAVGFSMLTSLGETMLADLREQVVDRALRLPLAQIEAAGSGDLASRVAGDVAVIANAVRNVFPTLAGSAVTIVLTVGGLLALDWRFALAGLCAAPVQIGTVIWYLRRSTPLYARERILEAERAQKLLDAVEGSRTVRAFGLHETKSAIVEEKSRQAVEFSFVVLGLRVRFFARVNTAEFVGVSAILLAGFFLVREGISTVGDTTAAALLFHRIFDPVAALMLNFDEGQNAASGLTRLVGVASLPARPERELPAPADASVGVRGVSFAYTPSHDVLSDIDLDVAPRERVALVGASGAGKTTLAKLLAGIHTPREGDILLGGHDLPANASDFTGRVVGLVTQEVHVFSGTLADDLRLAKASASDDELRVALDIVGALEWAERLPDGLETTVGEGAYRLTATQAQQLALARLVLTDPPIAILDEATAEAGSAGARLLERSVDAALRGRTALVVAHRLTQAHQSHRIVVLESGRVIETGTHDQLLDANGAYATLWAAWSDHRGATEMRAT